jgi:hypothetical protein
MKINGDEITIKNFSFVNGGQTSYMIGETEFYEDFYILVKIISTKNLNEDDKLRFNGKTTFKNLKPFLNLNSRRGSKIPEELKIKSEK